MKTAYFNCSSGIAGDMILSACIDAGLAAVKLEKPLKTALRFEDWSLTVRRVERNHFPARLLTVGGDRRFESPARIKRLISASRLPERAKKNSLAILERLVRAESSVHRVPPERVHFHELNSIDTLIDITGSCLALELLDIDEVYASALNLGRPAPATLEIVKTAGVPVYSNDPRHELTTPTGAAVIAQLARGFGEAPVMQVEATGFGAGMAQTPERPNLLTLLVGKQKPAAPTGAYDRDTVVVLETNIDDMDPRIYPYVMEKLLAEGARDAWLTQVLMKKGRPGIVLSVICTEELEERLARILFDETTTLGIRRIAYSRHILKRTLKPGKKIACLGDGRTRVKSEYEDSRAQALKRKVALRTLIR